MCICRDQVSTLWYRHTMGGWTANEGRNEEVLCVLTQEDLQDRLRKNSKPAMWITQGVGSQGVHMCLHLHMYNNE